MTKKAQLALRVVARFQRGQYRITEELNLSGAMWASLTKSGMVDGRDHRLTDAGWELADSLPDYHGSAFTRPSS